MTPTGLRVVAGDGTGDHLLDRHGGRVPPAWDPGAPAHRSRSSPAARSCCARPTRGRVVWRAPITVTPTALDWSPDGRYPRGRVGAPRDRARRGRASRAHDSRSAAVPVAAAFRPGTHGLRSPSACRAQRGTRSSTSTAGHARLLFAGPGTFGDLAWSPDGGWLLRRLADREPVGLPARRRTSGRSRTSGSSSRAPTISAPMLELDRPLVLSDSVAACCRRATAFPTQRLPRPRGSR